ncbi:biotin--[acetyl-CoA-carboxylase] ligase [Rathayibacter sp. YIM 133350]|uniref:biotin--[acetyl-CoA-carboxylase] ligase n=1 Tax=Rathayibacter sp. YIM 133350 TaxID=3131992 RepID=UPI00307F4CA2
MDFSRSRDRVSRFEFLDEAASTNDELVERAIGVDASAWGDFSVLVTDNQTMGRGRLGRTWMAPEGKSLATSVLLRPAGLSVERFGWLPLIAGAALTGAIHDVVAPFEHARTDVEDGTTAELPVELKWPNDVLIAGYKVCGILAELLPGGQGVVMGAGLNLALDEHDLPTLTSTSILLATGEAPDPDVVLAGYLGRFRELYERFVAADGDPFASGIHAAVTRVCGTLAAEVRVELPGGSELYGTAVEIDSDGRLVVVNRENGQTLAVAAGDVTHLRY